MSAAPDASAPAPAPDKGSSSGSPRYLVLLALTVVAAFFLGWLAAVAVAALLSFVPPIVGLLFGLVLAFGLPIFLAVRAARALKRKGRGVLLRRLVTAFLLLSTQLAVFGSVLQFSSRGSGHLAAAGAGVLHTFGGVPVLSGLLERHAKNEHVPLPYDDGAKVGPDGGVLVTDGGVLVDGGAASGVRDAGPASTAPKLSARAQGGIPVRTVALAATLASGAPAVVVVQLSFGGGATVRVVELAAFSKHGAITALSSADDGGVVAVLGGTHVVTSRPGRAAELAKALSRDAKLTQKEGKATFSYDLQTVRDVAIGPGGDVLAVVEVLDGTDASGALTSTLLHLGKSQATPTMLRRAGQPVPGRAESAALAFDLQPARGDGRVVIVESFRDGPDSVAPSVQGEQFTLNPERMLVMRLDQPKVLQEVVASDAAASGIADRTLQAFADAVALPDGRVVFDANFVEEGPSGWLFQWRAGGAPPQAIGAELFAARAASFSSRAPRVKLLDVEPDGAMVFLSADALVWSRLGAPKEKLVGVLGASAISRDSTPGVDGGAPQPSERARGTVARVAAPFVAQGGQWALALVRLEGAQGGADALVLASLADVKANVVEVLLASGQQLPSAPGSTVTLATLKLPIDDELLWTPAPADASAPTPIAPGPADAGAP